MSEVILVVLGRPEHAALLLDAASRLAGSMGDVRIQVLATREPTHVHTHAAGGLMSIAGFTPDAGRWQEQRISALRREFDRWTEEAGEIARGAHWTEAEGRAQPMVGEIGSRADVIVCEQPAENDRLARQAFRTALFGTDRPVLMVPPRPIDAFGRVVAVAWRDEKRAVNAIIPALRSLRAAEQVNVLVGIREGAQRPAMPRILLEHGIRADLHVLPIGSGPFGQALLDKAHQLSADLLVMGAYAHSPLRELIVGGVTRYMLAHADLPVFMRH